MHSLARNTGLLARLVHSMGLQASLAHVPEPSAVLATGGPRVGFPTVAGQASAADSTVAVADSMVVVAALMEVATDDSFFEKK
jgi:hypothetical protein